MTIYLGRIATIIRDNYISEEEGRELETALYAEDSIIDSFELTYLSNILDSASRGDISFEKKEHFDHFQHIVDQGLFSTDRLYHPLNDSEHLGDVARGGMKDVLPTVSGFVQNEDQSFTILLEQDETSTVLTLTEDTELDEIALAVSPFLVEEVFLAIEDLRCGDTSETLTQEEKQTLLTARQCLAKAYLRGIERGVTYSDAHPTLFNGHLIPPDEDPRPYLQHYRAEKELALLNDISSPPFQFRGEPLNEENTSAIHYVMQILPSGFINQFDAISLSLVPWNDIAAQIYRKANGSIYHLQTLGGFAGSVDKRQSYIYLDASAIPSWQAYALLHELGHTLSFEFIRNLTPESNLSTHSFGIFGSIVEQHMSKLNSRLFRKPILSKYNTHYGTTNELEWFAEAFATYYMGSMPENLRCGLTSLQLGIAAGPQALRERFRQIDPVGYLLMATLDYYLQTNNPNPEHVFTWTVYDAIQEFVNSRDRTLDEEDVKDWLDSLQTNGFNFSNEESLNAKYLYEQAQHKYSKDVMKIGEDEAQMQLVAALKNIHNKCPLYSLAENTYFFKQLRFANNPDFSKIQPQNLSDSFYSEFEAFFLQHPQDENNISFLMDVLSCHPMNQLCDEAPLLSDPRFVRAIDKITKTLIETDPNNPVFIQYRGTFLLQQQRYDEAITLFQTLLRDTQDPQISQMITNMLISAYMLKGSEGEAEDLIYDLIAQEPFYTGTLVGFYAYTEQFDLMVGTLNSLLEEDTELFFLTFPELPIEHVQGLHQREDWNQLMDKLEIYEMEYPEEMALLYTKAKDYERLFNLLLSPTIEAESFYISSKFLMYSYAPLSLNPFDPIENNYFAEWKMLQERAESFCKTHALKEYDKGDLEYYYKIGSYAD